MSKLKQTDSPEVEHLVQDSSTTNHIRTSHTESGFPCVPSRAHIHTSALFRSLCCLRITCLQKLCNIDLTMIEKWQHHKRNGTQSFCDGVFTWRSKIYYQSQDANLEHFCCRHILFSRTSEDTERSFFCHQPVLTECQLAASHCGPL